jgi:hypothetical protein
MIDCHLTVEKKPDEDSLVLKQTKLRQAEALKPFELHIHMGEQGSIGFEFVGQYEAKRKKTDEVIEAVNELLENGALSRPAILESLDEYGKDTIDAALKSAEEVGLIQRVPRTELPSTERKVFYRLAPVIVVENQLPVSDPYIEVESRKEVPKKNKGK